MTAGSYFLVADEVLELGVGVAEQMAAGST